MSKQSHTRFVRVSDAQKQSDTCLFTIPVNSDTEVEQTWRLLKHAPELLEALEALVNKLDVVGKTKGLNPMVSLLRDNARKALNKARGGSHD